jgi:hypothetical protein
MRQKSSPPETPSERLVRDIRPISLEDGQPPYRNKACKPVPYTEGFEPTDSGRITFDSLS